LATLKSQLHLSLFDGVSGPIRRIGAELGTFQARTRAMMAPLMGLGRMALFGGAVGAGAGISAAVGRARDMQAAFTEVGIKAGLADNQISALSKQITALAPKTNQTTEQLLAGIDTMVGLGLSASAAANAIPAIGKAATATGAQMADLAAASASAMQNLSVAPSEIARMLDAMAFAGNQGAFELRDMASYLPALGASYQALGQRGVPAVTDLAAALQIVRTGAGDSAEAANNLRNVLQKATAPQTRAAFKKMGINLAKEMTAASKKGMTPIEALAEITNKTLKGDLSKLGDLFSDAQVQAGLRPLIQQLDEYRRIRDEAARAEGTVSSAFARRMDNATEKLKAFSIRIENLGASVGTRLLGPIGDAAAYFTDVFDTLDQRVTVFDRIGAAANSFLVGLGIDGGTGGALKQLGDFLFGVAGPDGVKAGEELGAIAKQFREFGESIRSVFDTITESPLGKFLLEMSGYGLKLMLAAAGISLIAGAVMKLARATAMLSGITTALGIIKMFGRVGGMLGGWGATVPTGKTPPASKAPGAGGLLALAGKISTWLALLSLSGDTPKGSQSENWKDDPRADRWRREWEALHPNTGGADADRRREGDLDILDRRRTLDGFFSRPRAGFELPTNGKLPSVIRTEPTGVQAVRVTNPDRPNVINISVTGVSGDLNALANAVAGRVQDAIGRSIRSGLDSAFTDGTV